MQRPPAYTPAPELGEGFDPLLEGLVARRPIVSAARACATLRCASCGYLSDGHRCDLTIPERVVVEAWERERQFGNTAERFFRLVWADEVWLAYGRGDGTVRGVYCPEHRAERDERSFDFEIAGDMAISDQLALV